MLRMCHTEKINILLASIIADKTFFRVLLLIAILMYTHQNYKKFQSMI
jgi:hypothetical protein